MAIRQSSGNQTPIIENNAGTFQGTILHTGFDGTINGDFKFSSIALELSGHSFNAYFDTSTRRNYIHLYPQTSSDRGTSASTTDIRAWTGTTYKTLQIKMNSPKVPIKHVSLIQKIKSMKYRSRPYHINKQT